nr:hypothetical protein [Tanacetum cinerariifolium]
MLDTNFIPSDNSLPEYEIFYFDIKEKNSGSTTIHVDISLLDFECFNFDFKLDLYELTSIIDFKIRENVLSATNVNLPPEEDHSPIFAYVVWIFLSFLTYLVVTLNLLSFRNEDTIFDPGISNFHFPSLLLDVSHWIRENVPSATNVNLPPEEDHSPIFAYVIWIFLSFLTYLVVPPYLFSFKNEDTIFDPGIANYHFSSLLPNVSHRCETFMKFNVYSKLLNESPMDILSSSCSLMEQ